MTVLWLVSALGVADCNPAAARTLDHLLTTLGSQVPERGVVRLDAEEVARSFSLTHAETRAFCRVMRDGAIDAEGGLTLELERPFSFKTGDVVVELGERIEATFRPGAIVRIRGLEADGARVVSAVRRVHPEHGLGIELCGRNSWGIAGRRFLPL